MTVVAQEVTWGEAIVVAAFKAPRGLNGAVQAIHREVGPAIGSRNTFAKYMRVDSPAGLSDKDLFRVWLLLTALGADPARWGVNDEVVPAGYDLDRLKLELPRLDLNQRPSDYLSPQVRCGVRPLRKPSGTSRARRVVRSHGAAA